MKQSLSLRNVSIASKIMFIIISSNVLKNVMQKIFQFSKEYIIMQYELDIVFSECGLIMRIILITIIVTVCI